jgi:hypothetical protein
LSLGIFTAATLFLGYIGFRKYFIGVGDPRPPLNLLYLSIQLFTLESGSVSGQVPLTLDFARLAAPTIAALAGVKVLLQVFREEFNAFRIRRLRDHVVICGLGKRGLHYVLDFLKKSPVVVIERNEENDRIQSARTAGARILLGDATQAEILRQARVDRSCHLIAITGDDFTNMEIGEQARAIANGGSSGPLHCHTHVLDPQVVETIKVHELVWKRSEQFVLHVFSTYRDAARSIFEVKPLDWRPIYRDSIGYAHLIVCGFGRMGENVLLQAARIGHFANRERLRATVIDRQAQARYHSFLFRYPNIGNICDITVVNSEAEDPQVIEMLRVIAKDPSVIVSAVVCFESDERSLAYAIGLRDNMHEFTFPVSVRVPQESLISRIMGGIPSSLTDMTCFGACSECCTSERLVDEVRDKLARKIHEDYRLSEFRRNGANKNQLMKKISLQKWDLLREDFRESNRQAADHIPVKLRAVGCSFTHYEKDESKNRSAFTFTEEEIETMAIMEHNRWSAERWMAGWKKGPEDRARRMTPYLVEWEELSDKIKKYDIESVCNITNLVKVSRMQSISSALGYPNSS